ncbi:MAG: hypothetical protein HQL12_05350 [Candidatus Omnitrophica bacterium]|nr:hypothetical protein [Candidatus Omnitrophota bacterium]
MNRILFLVLSFFYFLGTQAVGAIEIYANGYKYDSLPEYQSSKSNAAKLSTVTTTALKNQQDDYIRQESKRLGINTDFSKIKTFQIKQKNVSDSTLHKLYVLSVEKGIASALREFYQTRAESDFQIPRNISAEQLQGAIQQAVTTSKGPKFLISGPGKVRIMALTADDTQQQRVYEGH